ncbi:hypothetical protein [Stenomitos frigidus]|uniref:hypothetical protein n=1 Tax=Stenomitos frigidus TaxID=1886765 RepID=UPI001FE3E234|nr:hypothetical protein [Stenomitos frigidus]
MAGNGLARDVHVTTSTDPFTRGLDYLYGVRSLALVPDMVDVVHDMEQRRPICVWVGHHIEAVNSALNECLLACHACFHPWEQPAIQIFAAPLAQSFGLDGLCNLKTKPMTILIDVGRLAPKDWLLLVSHEYAHAHAGSPGHHDAFARSLTHLCLGLGIVPPPDQAANLPSYPDYRSTKDPLAFWRGKGDDWRLRVGLTQTPDESHADAI